MGKRKSSNNLDLQTELGSELNALLVASRAIVIASAGRFHPTLQPAAYQLAVTLAAHGSAKAGQIATLLDMDKSAISRLAKSLCATGLAQSQVDPDDGRGIVYSLTETGRTRVDAASALKSDVFFERLDGWSEAELVQFTRLLRKFNRS